MGKTLCHQSEVAPPTNREVEAVVHLGPSLPTTEAAVLPAFASAASKNICTLSAQEQQHLVSFEPCWSLERIGLS